MAFALAASADTSKLVAPTETCRDEEWEAFTASLSPLLESSLTWDAVTFGPAPEKLLEATRRLCLDPKAKRTRPRVSYLSARTLGAPESVALAVASAVELFHVGSLMHDDVLDEADERRSQPTLKALWGNSRAVLAGDLALSLGLAMLRATPRETIVAAANAVLCMTNGAIAEGRVRGDSTVTPAIWRRIAAGKTGALFAFSGVGVAQAVSSLVAVERFSRYGEHVGVAFQIADDLLDGVADIKGRERFADLRNREMNLPTVLGCAMSASFRAEVTRIWAQEQVSSGDAEYLGGLLMTSGAPAAAFEQLCAELTGACEALQPYADHPAGAQLISWAMSIRQRTLAALSHHLVS
jgi:heptaprenyl diphosphate synthase